jgi:hypothetical protein
VIVQVFDEAARRDPAHPRSHDPQRIYCAATPLNVTVL